MGALLLYLENGRQAQESDPQGIRARLKGISGPYWLSLTAPDEETLAWLGQTFGFHHLTLEDCRVYNPRPKLEEYQGYLFLVAHEVSLLQEGFEARDLQFYFSQDYLVTVQKEESEALGRAQKEGADLSRGTDFLFYRLLGLLSDGYLALLEGLDERIDQLEEVVVASPAPPVLRRIFRLRHDLISLLRLGAPFREVLHQLSTRQYPYVRPAQQIYFRDVYNTLVSIHEMIESQRDLTGGALDVYMSAVSNNLNQVLKRLTLIATIFMPVSFIAAFWGMNFEFLPFHSPLVMWSTLALIVLLPLAMLGWFRARGWV